ncbi:hypothetical protein RvY_17276 [Ramazzottius varieornatus]|uniref:G-protein coupled receptors family 1 profile domain-containing protein n=1 Tax=Ramazzottius varieornatus TaxID=947166 RepID=A0A1D1W3U9_RAMVA|nr:hypothetical protein RvY_17276 [Ramazzottius varieornatus]
MSNFSFNISLSSSWLYQKNTSFPSSPASHDLVGYVAAVLTTNFVGLPINIPILLAIVLYPPLRKSTSGPLLAQCAAIDVLFSLVVGPMASLVRFFGMSYRYPPWFCSILFTLVVHTAHPASTYAACMIASQRLSATMFPHEHKDVSDRKVIVAMLITPWVMALGSVAFPMASHQLHTVQSAQTGGCLLSTVTSSTVRSLVFALVVTHIPTAVTGVPYISLLIKAIGLLRVEKRKQVVSKPRVDKLRRRLEIHVALTSSFVWHCLSIYPFTFIAIFFPQLLMSG